MLHLKNGTFLFLLIYFLSGCTGEQTKTASELKNQLKLRISGGEFENIVLDLEPTFASYGEENDYFLMGFMEVFKTDTTVVNLMFKGESPGVFPIEWHDTTDVGLENGFSFISWIGNEKPGSRYFIISKSGEINIEKLGNVGEVIVGSFKGYAFDQLDEMPQDTFHLEGTFRVIRGDNKEKPY